MAYKTYVLILTCLSNIIQLTEFQRKVLVPFYLFHYLFALTDKSVVKSGFASHTLYHFAIFFQFEIMLKGKLHFFLFLRHWIRWLRTFSLSKITCDGYLEYRFPCWIPQKRVNSWKCILSLNSASDFGYGKISSDLVLFPPKFLSDEESKVKAFFFFFFSISASECSQTDFDLVPDRIHQFRILPTLFYTKGHVNSRKCFFFNIDTNWQA